jgi:hypothetical protein
MRLMKNLYNFSGVLYCQLDQYLIKMAWYKTPKSCLLNNTQNARKDLIYDGTSLRLSIFLSCMPPDEPKYFKEQ